MASEDFCKMEYVKDEQGNESLLKEGKFQVMMQWEKPYMEACIDALKPRGDVLEVGFGLGFSAERIQSYKPKTHTIIEYHPEVIKRAKEWAKTRPGVIIVEGTWQEESLKLGIFDSIFFDDYPLQSEAEMTHLKKDKARSERVLESGKKVIEEVHEKLPSLKTMRYSDADLAEFMGLIASDQTAEPKQIVLFLSELISQGQISETQFQDQLKGLEQSGKITKQEIEALSEVRAPKEPFEFSAPQEDRFYTFLRECLRSHMRVGSCFSCFLEAAESKFEDEKFFNEIILNPLLDFHEEELELEVPGECTYFEGSKALVITITKQG